MKYKHICKKKLEPSLFTVVYNDNDTIESIDIYSDVMQVHLKPDYINNTNNVQCLNHSYIYLNYGLIEKIVNDLIKYENNIIKTMKVHDKIFNNIYQKHLEYLETIFTKGY